ncbi:MFS general substrate transporter [Fomes fomentarius]|nr:MFS general substrate transporter [Fomes fomentarius]
MAATRTLDAEKGPVPSMVSRNSGSLNFKEPSVDLEVQVDIFNGEEDVVDPVYQAKARILNAAFQEIGMGRYQWFLFFVGGFGWFASTPSDGRNDHFQPFEVVTADTDRRSSLVQTVSGLLVNPVIREFPGFQGPFLILGQTIGLFLGAVFWGVGCDIWGRRWSFNLTLFFNATFALAAGGAPNPVALCALIGAWSTGVGGNLPVDSAVFLEFVPATHQWLLTVLSIWWAIGQLVASLIAWPFIANFSCESSDNCSRSSNMGWRYLLWTLGGLMMVFFILRFFVFHLYESPKYLMGRGRDEEAVAVIQAVAKYNGKKSSLTLEILKGVEKVAGEKGVVVEEKMVLLDTSAMGAIRRKLSLLNMDHLKSLFATKMMGYSTTLLIILWAFIGLAYPLYNNFVTVFLQTRGADFGDGSLYITYRNQAILSTMGIPGSLLAGWMVEQRFLGRKGTLAIFSALTGVFLFASTTARSSDALLGWNCGYTFANNVMYGTLYALSPEIFPAKDRGTGNALVAAANRIFGIMAPVIALYADLTTPVPIYLSGALFVVSGSVALLLPFEPRGRASI